ncbi:MAG: squalene/phytoene synthase family protein [Elusimicrobiota bacterium]|jgi:farnesyl-diphosphate farnesyltransferase|nr:squalene/phytoene synthase family protein [Elusimicrobiota bacterium]
MNMDTLLKSTARSLYLSARVLPRKIRKTFYCGYLLCRAADTVADTNIIDGQKRLNLIKNFPKIIKDQDKTLISEFKTAIPKETDINAREKLLLDNIDLYLEEYNALNYEQKKIILDVARAVCGAMEWDLTFFPSQDSDILKAVFDDNATINYCDQMGGEPGIFWAKLLLEGKQDDEFANNAKNIGRALQITNILRDMPNDIAIGRCYLPLTDLTNANLMPQDLLDKKTYKKLKPVVLKWISWGVENLKSAPAFFVKIPKIKFGARAAVAWPVLWSLDTLYFISNAKNLLDKTQRVKISKKIIYLTILATPLYCLSNNLFNLIIKHKIAKLKKLF